MAAKLLSFYQVFDHQKADLLLHLFTHDENYQRAIVLVRSRDQLHALTALFTSAGIAAESISGTKKPEVRKRDLHQLQYDELRVLLTTEAVLRDADLSGVRQFIHFDFHELDVDYLARVALRPKKSPPLSPKTMRRHSRNWKPCSAPPWSPNRLPTSTTIRSPTKSKVRSKKPTPQTKPTPNPSKTKSPSS